MSFKRLLTFNNVCNERDMFETIFFLYMPCIIFKFVLYLRRVFMLVPQFGLSKLIDRRRRSGETLFTTWTS